MKKLISLAATATIVAATALPAMASSPTVTIQWNVAKTATMNLYENYSNTGTTSTTLSVGSEATYGALLTGQNGGSGSCAGTGGSITESTTAGILNLGTVTPDAAQPTDCVFLNGAEAAINSNDATGVTLEEGISVPTNNTTTVCGVAVVSGAYGAWQSAGVAGSTLTAAHAYDSADTTNDTGWTGATCAGLKYSGTLVSAQGTVGSTALANTVVFLKTNDSNGGTTMYAGEDFAVIFPAYASSTAGDSSTVTYTLLTNP